MPLRPSLQDRQQHTSLLFVAAGLALIAIVTYLIEGPREMNDFEVFRRAGARFLNGEQLYRAEDGHFEFKYLPISGAFFAPLTVASMNTAKILWLAGSWLATSLTFALSCHLFRNHLPIWAAPAALVVFARSIEREFAHGQVNVHIALLIIAAFTLMQLRRDLLAGVLLAIASLLKPPWLLLFVYLLGRRRWRAAGALGASFGVGLVLPMLRYGVGGTFGLHREMSVRLAASTARLLTYPTNVSLPGALAKLTGATLPHAALAAVAFLALPCLVLAYRLCVEPVRNNVVYDLAAIAPLPVLLSPQAWDYTVLMTLPTLLLAVQEVSRSTSWFYRIATATFALVVAIDYDLMVGRYGAFEAVMHWSPNTWFLLWMFGVGVWYHAQHDARAQSLPTGVRGEHA